MTGGGNGVLAAMFLGGDGVLLLIGGLLLIGLLLDSMLARLLCSLLSASLLGWIGSAKLLLASASM
jgi:hypothetical protein